MKLKERAILYANRPLAICPAEDIGLERHGCLVDEDVALRLCFPIRNLQYVHLNLFPNDKKRRTRITGTVRVTIQDISQGRAGNSFALKARVVRDLFNFTGAEALSDSILSKKLAGNSLKKEEERSRDTSPITGIRTGNDISKIDDMWNARESHSDDNSNNELSDSELSDVSSCFLCEDYSCSGHSGTDNDNDEAANIPQDKAAHIHRVNCALHGFGETCVRRVRGRNKFLQEIRARTTDEDRESLKVELENNQKKTPDETLDELFPGGAQNAHDLLNLWEKRASGTHNHEPDPNLPDGNRLPTETKVIDVNGVLVAQDTYSDGEIHRDGRIRQHAPELHSTYVSDGIWNYFDSPSESEPEFCTRTACYCHTPRGKKLCRTRFPSTSSSEPDFCTPSACYCHTPRGKKLCRTRF